jgi:hypothetical protein
MVVPRLCTDRHAAIPEAGPQGVCMTDLAGFALPSTFGRHRLPALAALHSSTAAAERAERVVGGGR